MKLYRDIEQGTPEWHALRAGRFTASDAQSIGAEGKGLETLAFEKVAEIKTGKSKESYTNDDMERGHQLEAEARNSYEIETGNTVEQIAFAELDEMIGASPDGLVGEDGLIEIKCPSDVVYTRYLYTGDVDPKYYAQMQMQMYVTGRKWCDYVVYNPNFERSIVIKRVEIDENAQYKIQHGLKAGVELVKKILEKIWTTNPGL